jgi:hypothetical protein
MIAELWNKSSPFDLGSTTNLDDVIIERLIEVLKASSVLVR